MNHNEFIESTKLNSSPKEIDGVELALWYAVKGDWDMAHNIAQEINTETASWIHAYLHRQEGDISNAHYWYSHAKKNPYSKSLADELKDIVESIFPILLQFVVPNSL